MVNINKICLLFLVLGKTEGTCDQWHGHVTALTVSPLFRRLGIADHLMQILENVSDSKDAYFVDLYVRPSNILGVKMYEKRNYSIYQTVLDYYSEDANNQQESAYGKKLL